MKNNEIKEILDDLKDEECYYAYIDGRLHIDLNKDEANLLLDYITNLQQENERLKELDENYPIEEELAEAYRREQDYKSRCEKAVEYLKSKEDSLFMSFSDDMLDHDELIDKKIGMTLLNILNGRSDEK